MFGISSGELFFIAIIALIVLGPERLPKATRFAGLWVRRARAQWYSVKDELEREMAADELKRSLRDAQEAASNIEKSLRETGNEAQREFNDLRDSVRSTTDADPMTEASTAISAPADAALDSPATTEQGAGDAPRT